MVQECYERSSPAHNPPTFRTDVVHLSMNIVQVVHHGGADADTCTEQSCQDRHSKGNQHLAEILSKAEPEVRTIITIDETAEDVIKRIVDTAKGKPVKKANKQPALPVPDFKYKALDEDSSASVVGKQ